jgi:long-chain acyl-CoA synthetase
MLGGVVVPLNTELKGQEIHYILEDSECKMILFFETFEKEIINLIEKTDSQMIFVLFGKSEFPNFIHWEDFIQQGTEYVSIPESNSDADAVILYTSGTTGHPKGVVLSHKNLFSNASACIETGSVSSNDIFLSVLPLYHSFGQTVVMNTCIASGALNVMLPTFDPNLVIKTIIENNISIFAAVPTMFKMILSSNSVNTQLPSLRLCLSGGAKLDLNLFHEFQEKFGHKIYEGYGLTEAAPVVSFNPMDYRSKAGSVGLPLPGIEVKIVDEEDQELTPGNEGEILVKGKNIMKGYLNRPEATKEIIKNDFLYTGDIGKIDDDGYIFILDRKGDLIIKGGFNVYPKEIEQVLSYHPKVNEVAVIGVPDPVQGEEVKAYISLKSGKRVSKKEIFEYCKEHLANYKCPKYITFLRNLPKSSSGKILKRKLFIKKSNG